MGFELRYFNRFCHDVFKLPRDAGALLFDDAFGRCLCRIRRFFHHNGCFRGLWGAVVGDQAGYAVGKRGREWLQSKIQPHPKRAEAFSKARSFTENWGGPGVFLSRWLLSPLGPYVNFAGGIVEMPWLRFTIWAALGEIVWVTLYVGLGFFFAAHIEEVASFLGNTIGVVTGLAVTITLGVALYRAHPKSPKHTREVKAREGV
ncbi:DedA family protein [Falsihalocynthiibacter arcticus]|uniref:VTT domain-containing protein n=1 Tax=Falsihalocynthiibacter arcticus TaxID=1579316 RepID=A0A126UYL5_9RHOB|nr:VTT domain-containing protein [Falsihalocynthiibacter arcticus]AML51158.1 hypothetical protein RC74_07700 [Falsihalocynthiibacter arcticus]